MKSIVMLQTIRCNKCNKTHRCAETRLKHGVTNVTNGFLAVTEGDFLKGFVKVLG